MAMRTERIHLGPLVTPLARRRPWKLARETVTLDHLSGGRLVLPVRLGAVDDGGFSKVGEVLDRRTRAELLDEGLAIVTGLWSGEGFEFRGEHYEVEEMTFLPRPVQSPRIPIWVIGAWPSEPSLRRALRWGGIVPIKRNAEGAYMDLLTPEDLRALRAYVAEHRGPDHYEIIYEGESPSDDLDRAAATVYPYAEAGATWWIESVWASPWERGGLAGMRTRIRQGPPRTA
jgi:alkanesulfonate monooxygenase SsuD/methylene tetrahydromethanopterin reductase-like flavin-dependent oxidoreductase (luciferase family)